MIFAFLTAFLLISSATAAHWSGRVGTNTSSWYIYRQSETMAFNLTSSVEGRVSPIEYHGSTLNPYYSSYMKIIANDVWLNERTSAYSGKISYDSDIKLESDADNDINITINKPYDVAAFEHNEQWPARIIANGSLVYQGREINSHMSEGNNGGYIKSNFLYGPELNKQWKTISILERMNATVKATNEGIIYADFMPTRYLAYQENAHTTGLADLSYKLSGPIYGFGEKGYPSLAQGEETYYGVFDLSRLIGMRSLFNNYSKSDSWLPCCDSSGFEWDLNEPEDQNAEKVFNCLCYVR